MTTQLEAMKMMVEALEYYSGLHRPETDSALAAGRAAIEAAEKVEPVAWVQKEMLYDYGFTHAFNIQPYAAEGYAPLYLHPPSAEIEELRKLIANERYALSFQTLGQYRSALLKRIAAMQEKQP